MIYLQNNDQKSLPYLVKKICASFLPNYPQKSLNEIHPKDSFPFSVRVAIKRVTKKTVDINRDRCHFDASISSFQKLMA